MDYLSIMHYVDFVEQIFITKCKEQVIFLQILFLIIIDYLLFSIKSWNHTLKKFKTQKTQLIYHTKF